MTEREKLGAKLNPALREWADRVIIPALAREILAQGPEEGIAVGQEDVTKFTNKKRLSAEVTT